MKKRKTTYGVYGLIEWGARIPFGKGCVQISFSGGSKTPNGIIPATYTTDNPVIQLAIEQSPDFRAGKIRSVRTIPLNEEIRVHTNPAPSLPPGRRSPRRRGCSPIPLLRSSPFPR